MLAAARNVEYGGVLDFLECILDIYSDSSYSISGSHNAFLYLGCAPKKVQSRCFMIVALFFRHMAILWNHAWINVSKVISSRELSIFV